MSPIGDTDLNESQVRALLPLASQHGTDAAVTVYGTVAEIDGVPLTATVLADVVRQLQDGADPADPAAVWAAEADRLRTVVRRAVTRPAFRAAARARPEEARAVVAELRALLDEVESAALASDEP